MCRYSSNERPHGTASSYLKDMDSLVTYKCCLKIAMRLQPQLLKCKSNRTFQVLINRVLGIWPRPPLRRKNVFSTTWDSESLAIHDGPLGIYPEHWRTGKRGYLGKVESVAERLHIQNVEPRTDSICRAYWQSKQRLPRSRSVNDSRSSAMRNNNTPTEPSVRIICYRNAVLTFPEAQKATFRERRYTGATLLDNNPSLKELILWFKIVIIICTANPHPPDSSCSSF